VDFFLPARFCVGLGCACSLPACLPAASVSAAAAAACCRFACFSPLRCFAASWLSRRWLSLFGYLMIPFSVQQQFCAATTTKTTTSSSHLIDLGSWVVVVFLAILIQVYLNLYL